MIKRMSKDKQKFNLYLVNNFLSFNNINNKNKWLENLTGGYKKKHFILLQ